MDLVLAVSDFTASASCSRAFSVGDLLGLMDEPVDRGLLRSGVAGDSRFVALHLPAPDEERFILDSCLFRWLCDLNIRLGRAATYRLTTRQLALAMSNLLLDGRWAAPPRGAIRWGRSLGLVSPSYAGNHYVFPLARILSTLSEPTFRLVIQILDDIGRQEVWRTLSAQWVEEQVENGLSELSERVEDIVRKRTGLPTGVEMTLEEVGSEYGFTRERARQLENKFWDSLQGSRPVDRRQARLFLTAFLSDFMNESGSLVVRQHSPKRPLRSFLAKCAGLSHVSLPSVALVILAASRHDAQCLEPREWFPDELEQDAIVTRLESYRGLALVDSDVKLVATRMARYRHRRLKGTQRVYLALRAIGKPAHYSDITRAHNELFPRRAATEETIGARLAAAQHGVVWLGTRGIYALREWGYERPSVSLFDRVKEIVEKAHAATGRPVPFAVIVAEIGKDRSIVNPNSLTIAASCNPGLVRVDKSSFIPKPPDQTAPDEMSSEELDRILQDFAPDSG